MLKLIFVLTLLSTSLTAGVQFNDSDYPSQNTLSCLENSGFLDFAFVYSFLSVVSKQKLIVTNITFLNNFGIIPHVLLVRWDEGQFTPYERARIITNDLKNKNVSSIIWIGIKSNHNGGTCQYLEQLVQNIEQLSGKYVGIKSTAGVWKNQFGSIYACPQLGGLPLWYGSNDAYPVTSQFQQFGAWTDYVAIDTDKTEPCPRDDRQYWRTVSIK